MLLRGGLLPPTAVSPAAMWATGTLLRQRTSVMRQRAELLAPIQNTKSHSHLPERGKKIAATANRDGGAARFPAPVGQQSIAGDPARRSPSDPLLQDVERSILQTAQPPHAQPLSLRRTVPGIGARLSVGRLSDIHNITRFPRGLVCLS